MSDEEIGVYVKMLAAQWLHGSLPKCKKTIKKMINSRKVPSEMVMLKFALCDDGFLRNERLEKERAKQKSFAESRKDNANKRWNKDALASPSAMHVHNASTCITDAFHLQSSSSSSDIELRKRERERKPVSENANSRARSIDEMLGDLPESEPTPKPRELTPAQEAMQRINGLKPEWAKPSHWTAAEMHELHGSLSAVCELSTTDWDMLRRYLVAKLPQGAGYWQPPSRSQFVKAFCDVFQHAQRWSDKQGGSFGTPQNNNLNPYA